MSAPVLDLAFTVEDTLPAPLAAAAAGYGDPLAGAMLWERILTAWLAQLAPDLAASLRAPAYSLGLNLCCDAAIAALNAEWRQVEGPTDVLAFAAVDEGIDGTPPMPMPRPDPLELGDIVISLETAARQAAAAGTALERELTWLASHGLLHLLGWDHPTEARLAAMLERQELLLSCAR